MIRKQFVICVDNQGYQASLEVRKVYELVADEKAATLDLLRVVDESGEDYLYPKNHFVSLELPEELEKALHLTSQ